MADFKPNMMPLMYWALAYGAAAGVLLFILFLLSSFITIVWFPVFLAGVVWGGFRNYQRQKQQWYAASGTTPPPQSAMAEFRQAASDIAASSQDFVRQSEDVPPESAPPQDEEPLPPGPPA